MSKICPVCKTELEEQQQKCEVCGALVKESIPNEVLETELVNDHEMEYQNLNQTMLQELFARLDPKKQRIFTSCRMNINKKLIMFLTFMFYTGPIAMLMTSFSAYKIGYLIINYKDYNELSTILPPGLINVKSKKDLILDFLFMIGFFLISTGLSYYVWIWLKQQNN